MIYHLIKLKTLVLIMKMLMYYILKIIIFWILENIDLKFQVLLKNFIFIFIVLVSLKNYRFKNLDFLKMKKILFLIYKMMDFIF